MQGRHRCLAKLPLIRGVQRPVIRMQYPFLGLLVEDRLIDRDERELSGNEDESASGQDDLEPKHEGGRVWVPPSTRPGRLAGTRAEKG